MRKWNDPDLMSALAHRQTSINRIPSCNIHASYLACPITLADQPKRAMLIECWWWIGRAITCNTGSSAHFNVTARLKVRFAARIGVVSTCHTLHKLNIIPRMGNKLFTQTYLFGKCTHYAMIMIVGARDMFNMRLMDGLPCLTRPYNPYKQLNASLSFINHVRASIRKVCEMSDA